MFVNLHTHSNYSHDSFSQIKKMVDFVKENGQSALAITDHGNMSGCVELVNAATKAGIKPIIGMEAYICHPHKSAQDKSPSNKSLNHLVLLAKNTVGYKNLLKLTKYGAENFYYRPRIDEEFLFAHSEGLIALNGHHTTSIFDCLFEDYKALNEAKSESDVEGLLRPNYMDLFKETAARYSTAFKERFFVESQLFDLSDPVQQFSGKLLIELAEKFGYQVAPTGDAHYIKRENAIAHKTFCAIKNNTKIKDMPNISYFNSGAYSLIDSGHADKCWPKHVLENAQKIADMVEDYDILKPHNIPVISANSLSTLKDLARDGLKTRNVNTPAYVDRLNEELRVIEMGKLADYFLIVADYVNYAKANGAITSPGRGSAGGCLVSYLLGITNLDPIKYNLLFERFYSEDRAKNNILPDIDVDFPTDFRDRVVDYLIEKYGEAHVSGAVTFNTLQGKGAIKDVLRVWSAADYQSINNISKMLPSRDKISDKLEEFKEETGSESIIEWTLVNEPDLLADYARIEDDKIVGDFAQFFKIAIELEGAIKSESKHASAYIISSDPINDYAPICKDKNTDNLLCALDMNSFPYVSLVKFDILGLKNLDGLLEINKIIKEIGIC